MQRKRRWVHSTHRTPLSLHPLRFVGDRVTSMWTAAGAGAACIATGALLAVVPEGSADVGVVPTSTTIPVADAAADRPNAVAVAGTVPVAVSLPDRHVSAPVVPTSTAPDGALVVPDPPTTVGWWAPGALAGAPSGT